MAGFIFCNSFLLIAPTNVSKSFEMLLGVFFIFLFLSPEELQ